MKIRLFFFYILFTLLIFRVSAQKDLASFGELKDATVFCTVSEALRDSNQAYILNLDYTSECQKKLDSFPHQIILLRKLQVLSIKRHNIDSISSISELQNLQVLKLDKNNFHSIPYDIFKLSRLKFLSLSGNKIKIVSTDITNLKNLRILNLAGNQIKMLPEGFSILTNLISLDLSNNPISEDNKQQIKKILPNTKIIF
jgi:Leucine-rich repeat (LRR) protein